MRLLLGAGFFVGGGGGLDDRGFEEEDEDLMASELPGFAVEARFETASSVLGFMFNVSSSRFRLPDDGVVVGPFRCSSVVESLTGTFDESFAADATRSFCFCSGFRLFFGRLVSRYLKWSS